MEARGELANTLTAHGWARATSVSLRDNTTEKVEHHARCESLLASTEVDRESTPVLQ